MPKARPIQLRGSLIEQEKFEKIAQAFKDKNIELKIEVGCPVDNTTLLEIAKKSRLKNDNKNGAVAEERLIEEGAHFRYKFSRPL